MLNCLVILLVVLDSITASEQEVYDLIQSLDSTKSTGHDGISVKILKGAGKAIVPSLTLLINLCLKEKVFPDEWKKANVLPLHKKDSKSSCSNYRPASILPVVSKILERIVSKNVYNFFHENNLLTVHQSGFRQNDSTINQLAYLYHSFCKALDMKKDIRIVYCDITKAFDRVWHEGIIYKLKNLGIVGNLLTFFENYLSNRKQRVVINGQCSEWGHVKSGVPQGSVLGPLLFLVYINDLVKSVNCGVKLFADDTVLYEIVTDQETSARVLNENLRQIELWASQWLVKFNPDKTKLMNVSLKRNQTFENFPIYFSGSQLQVVTSHRHLGLEIRNDLKWSNHIDSLVNGISKLCDVMYKLKYKLDRETLQTLYFTYVRPKLEYASIIWDDCTEMAKDKLEHLQLMFARIVTGAKRGTSHRLLYNELQYPTLACRRSIAKLKFMHKIINKRAPDYLIDILPLTSSDNNMYTLLSKGELNQHATRAEKFRMSLIPDCIRKWNSLSPDVRTVVSFKEFTNAIAVECIPCSLYNGKSRKASISHAQFRLNCSNLNFHLFCLHVLDNPHCVCSNKVEDCEHFFFQCYMHNQAREIFIEHLNQLCTNVEINTDLLLYGSDMFTREDNIKLFSLVENYIIETGRF